MLASQRQGMQLQVLSWPHALMEGSGEAYVNTAGALLTDGLSVMLSPAVVGEFLALSSRPLGAGLELEDLLSSDSLKSEVPSSETNCRSLGATGCIGVALVKRRPGMSRSKLFALCAIHNENVALHATTHLYTVCLEAGLVTA